MLTPILGQVNDGGNYFVFYTMLDNTYKGGDMNMIFVCMLGVIICLVGAIYHLLKDK